MALLPPFGPLSEPSYFDPYLSFGYDPFSYGNTRRRTEESAGGGTAVAGGRTPYTVGAPGWTRSIPCDFIEREKEYVVRADIPGVHKDEIHVEVHDENVLRFGHNPKAEREKEDEEEKGVFHRAERVSSFRNRNLRMPDDCDLKGEIKATYEDGVLTITIPKREGVSRGPGKLVPIT